MILLSILLCMSLAVLLLSHLTHLIGYSSRRHSSLILHFSTSWFFIYSYQHLWMETCLLKTLILQGQMKLEREQIMSLFIKVMKKFYKYLYGISSKEIESTLPRLKEVSWATEEVFPRFRTWKCSSCFLLYL